MNTISEVDQLFAAMRESEKVWPYNAHLIEDEYISEVVRESANGRERDATDAIVNPDSGPRIVNAEDLNEGFRSIHSASHVRHPGVYKWCDRCDFLKREVRLPETEFFELGVLAPPSIVRMLVCPVCKIQLDNLYGGIHWGVSIDG